MGDSKEPGFDRLWYYIQKMDDYLTDNADEINLADMGCVDAQPVYAFLARFFASGRVELPFHCAQSPDDHRHVVRQDPSKDDEPDDMPEDGDDEV